MDVVRNMKPALMSPSLRGSGLKYPPDVVVRHPTGSPSLRGSGLK